MLRYLWSLPRASWKGDGWLWQRRPGRLCRTLLQIHAQISREHRALRKRTRFL